MDLPTPLAALDHGIAMIHQELNLMSSMTVAENIFVNEVGEIAHQIMFLWEVSFVDPALYEREIFTVTDTNAPPLEAHWVSPAELAQRGIHLFPIALREAL